MFLQGVVSDFEISEPKGQLAEVYSLAESTGILAFLLRDDGAYI